MTLSESAPEWPGLQSQKAMNPSWFGKLSWNFCPARFPKNSGICKPTDKSAAFRNPKFDTFVNNRKIPPVKRNTLVLVMLLASTILYGQDDATRKKEFNVVKNVALEGYDPVSYFDRQPREGQKEIQIMYRGLVYYFTDKRNLARFQSAPEKFEPAYGGWCAYAMGATGEKVKVDPETYKIIDGKLYLFYNFWGNNTLSKWDKNESQLKTKGDENWRKIIH